MLRTALDPGFRRDDVLKSAAARHQCSKKMGRL